MTSDKGRAFFIGSVSSDAEFPLSGWAVVLHIDPPLEPLTAIVGRATQPWCSDDEEDTFFYKCTTPLLSLLKGRLVASGDETEIKEEDKLLAHLKGADLIPCLGVVLSDPIFIELRDLVIRLIKEHGLHASRFYRERLSELYCRNREHFQSFLRAKCEIRSYYKSWPKASPLDIIFDFSFSQILADIIPQLKMKHHDRHSSSKVWHRRYEDLDNWLSKSVLPRTCKLCGKPFRIQEIRGWVYFGSNGCEDCCFTCEIVEYPSRAELKGIIPAFIAQIGFIPHSNFGPLTRSFSRTLRPDQYLKALRSIGQMGGIHHVTRVFGSWIEALYSCGIISERKLKKGMAYTCIANDGHECNSLAELLIDNYLHRHRIDHVKEPHYPVHEDYNPRGRRRADWLVQKNVYVEYFGLAGDDLYDRKVDEKIKMANELGLALIAIFPSDVHDLDGVFRRYVAYPKRGAELNTS